MLHPISAVLADVNGTLVTKDKLLTPGAIAAVNRLRQRGVVSTICSGRPPCGPTGNTMYWRLAGAHHAPDRMPLRRRSARPSDREHTQGAFRDDR